MTNAEFSNRWIDAKRPPSVKYMVLPESFNRLVKMSTGELELSNILVHSASGGTGKSTFVKAIKNDLGMETRYINASACGGIDNIRDNILMFSKTHSLNKKKKLVIIDEMDGSSAQFQKALRALVEEVADNCRFLITCNYIDSIMPQLQSRFDVYDFNHNVNREEMENKFFVFSCKVLKAYKVEYEEEAVFAVVKNNFPDFRNTIKTLQIIAESHTKIDQMSVKKYDSRIDGFMESVIAGKVVSALEFLRSNAIEPQRMYRLIYDWEMQNTSVSILPNIISTITEYIDLTGRSFDREITFHDFIIKLIMIHKGAQ